MSNERAAQRVEVAPGDRVGKFRVERVLGRGGMGVVVEATNEQLDQRVALKLLAAGGNSPEAIEAVLNEARAAARLRSDHVARIQDVDTDPVYGPYIVMELLKGSTLADMLAESKQLPVRRAVEYVIDACEGLAEAFVRGIVHQDIKPANLFVAMGNDGRPVVKILDFGIAKMRLGTVLDPAKSATAGSIDLRISSSQKIALGTPFYLAPEQLRGESSVDHRADIWALGCVLFELVTGQKAFFAERFSELVVRVLEGKHAAVPAGVDVPAGVLQVIDRCLEKSADKRFVSTGELALALLPFARQRAHSVTARAVARVRDAGLDPSLSMPSSMPPPPSDASVDLVSSQSLRLPVVPAIVEEPPTPRVSPLTQPLVAMALAGIAVCMLVAAFLVARQAPSTPTPTPAATVPPTSVATVAVVPIVLAAPAPSPSPSSTAEAADADVESVKPFTAAPATEMTALPTFAPSARAPQRAPTPNSEIRTTR